MRWLLRHRPFHDGALLRDRAREDDDAGRHRGQGGRLRYWPGSGPFHRRALSGGKLTLASPVASGEHAAARSPAFQALARALADQRLELRQRQLHLGVMHTALGKQGFGVLELAERLLELAAPL